jgi:beta-lactamase regulating signal transducer with metallopeptidase domain
MFNFELLPEPAAFATLVWAAETAVVASILALVAHFAARQRWLALGPAARHVLWLVVLIKLVTPPLIHWPWSASIATQAILDGQLAKRAAGTDGPAGSSLAELAGQPATTAFDLTHTACGQDQLHPSLVGIPSDRRIAAARRVDLIGQSNSKSPVQPRASFDGNALGQRAAQWALAVWLTGSILVGARQGLRILRSRRMVRGAVEAPEWVEELSEEIGWLLSVQPPEIRVTASSGTPRLWCLGRPVLLIPKELLATLKADRWRGILMHELAHLRRGDHWVSRIELAAGLVWWWNSVYWWAIRRLDAEAELACDAWVVSSLPQQRLTYAESLVQICSSLSLARSPSLSLGVTGAGHFLERRLTMILNERVPCRLPVVGYLTAALLVLLTLPAWLVAAPAARASGFEPRLAAVPAPGAAQDPARDKDDEDDDEDDEDAIDEEELEREIKKALGPDFEKKMQAIGEKIGQQMEEKFGPGSEFEEKMKSLGKDFEKQFGDDFAKKMEAFGKDIEKQFGDDFVKKIEAFGKDIEAKFGPDFQKKMEAFGKDIEKSFGPGFEESMKALGEDLAKELGPGSDFERAIKQAKEKVRAKAKRGDTSARGEDEASRLKEAVSRAVERARAAEARVAETRARASEDRTAARSRAQSSSSARAARIRALESRIQDLARELERLKNQEDEEDEGDE